MIRLEECEASQNREQIASLFAAVYSREVLEKIVWRDVKSAKAERRVIAFDNLNKIVAAAGLVFREGLIDGQPARIGGIGGVMTSPEMQGQGIGKAVMLHTHGVLMRDSQVAFGLLFCEPNNIPFYEKCGWVVFQGTVFAEQTSCIAPYNLMTSMVRGFHSNAPLGGTIDLRGLPW